MSATATLSRRSAQTLPPVAGPIKVRAIQPTDTELLRHALDGVSQRGCLRRFQTPVPRFLEALLTWMTDVDGVDHAAFVALEGATCVGLARYVRRIDDPSVAEVALTVLASREGRGVGRRLADALADTAAENGVDTLVWLVQPNNIEARALLRALGGYVVIHNGLVEGHLRLTERRALQHLA